MYYRALKFRKVLIMQRSLSLLCVLVLTFWCNFVHSEPVNPALKKGGMGTLVKKGLGLKQLKQLGGSHIKVNDKGEPESVKAQEGESAVEIKNDGELEVKVEGTSVSQGPQGEIEVKTAGHSLKQGPQGELEVKSAGHSVKRGPNGQLEIKSATGHQIKRNAKGQVEIKGPGGLKIKVPTKL